MLNKSQLINENLKKFFFVQTRFLEADFEEVGPRNVPEDFDELDKLGVINVCGVDRDGRPIIIVAMAENKIIFIKKKLENFSHFFKICEFFGFSKKSFDKKFFNLYLSRLSLPQ